MKLSQLTLLILVSSTSTYDAQQPPSETRRLQHTTTAAAAAADNDDSSSFDFTFLSNDEHEDSNNQSSRSIRGNVNAEINEDRNLNSILNYIRNKQYNLNTYPNPYYPTNTASSSSACRIPQNSPPGVAFCDPDHVLSSFDIPQIVQTISTFPHKHTIPCPAPPPGSTSMMTTTTTTTTGVQIGIALMSSMNVPAINSAAAGNKYGYDNNDPYYNNSYDYTNQGVQAAGETFAKYLHHAWGVGDNNACPIISTATSNNNNNNAGILVLLSVNDHEIYIATGNLVKQYLPDWKVKMIIEEIKPWLRMQSFGVAMRLILKESGSYIDHSSSSSSSSYDDYAAASTISTVIGYVIFFACCGLCCSACCSNWNKCGRPEYHSQWNDSWEHEQRH
eukprot:CAMPEP_0196808132 /NCGR_PEP_ID=MMETSP1362-20130617/8111_1 /TAXON_ID=163516 /ORGANISM="Leptocylindrus danicus, Strain CCMP1856" /LENGTH=389 /DNA_ID=CAMNT_0042182335 /DNA_START=58 /DNA_END=1224 /DNA_ORIENTATION=-